ncbi:hypothetical protein, partial [Nocardia abscessus]|uniref:hypothetical protein n=1 Tax=Nocardia abscessus TaxID=120957 RepID=UPI0024580EBE
ARPRGGGGAAGGARPPPEPGRERRMLGLASLETWGRGAPGTLAIERSTYPTRLVGPPRLRATGSRISPLLSRRGRDWNQP